MHSKESKSSLNKAVRNFLELLRRSKPNKVLFVCHRSADPDSYLSCFALSWLVKKVAHTRTMVAVPSDESELLKKLREKYKMKDGQANNDYDLCIAVDVGNIELLGEWKDIFSMSKRLLIDHHPHTDLRNYDLVLLDESAISTSEIVLRLFDSAGIKPSRLVSQAMLDAIIYDSQHLAIATENTLFSSVKLISYGASLEVAREEVRSERSYSEVIARLKSAMRMQVYKADSLLICFTKVNSFQAQCARGIIQLGADLAIAAGISGSTTRISMRATQNFFSATGIHLGRDLAYVVAAELGGSGGGHSTAASLTCASSVEDALSRCKIVIERLISSKLILLRP
jgi:nanoRNase/pAp phosphatase (c-di-AMP/oligoRNAs hydrolase)